LRSGRGLRPRLAALRHATTKPISPTPGRNATLYMSTLGRILAASTSPDSKETRDQWAGQAELAEKSARASDGLLARPSIGSAAGLGARRTLWSSSTRRAGPELNACPS